jgi:hypothetical protein
MKKKKICWMLVAHSCNLSYSEIMITIRITVQGLPRQQW